MVFTRSTLDTPELEAIQNHYHFHIYAAYLQPDEAYLLETDAGLKRMDRLRDPEQLNWAFLWREVLVEQGFRQVDRFLLTGEKEAFLPYVNEYLVVRDYQDGAALCSADSEDIWPLLGTALALLQRALEQAFQGLEKMEIALSRTRFTQSAYPLPFYYHRLKRLDRHLAKVLLSQWHSLHRRCHSAGSLFRKSEALLPQLVSLPRLTEDNWKIIAGRCLYLSGPLDRPGLGLRGMAQLIRMLWLKITPDLTDWISFWDAFNEEYQLTTAHGYHLLSLFIYPDPWLHFIRDYVYLSQSGLEDEQALLDRWYRVVNKQQHLDRLARSFAHWLDRKGG